MSELEKKLLTFDEASKLLNIKISRLRTAVFRKEIPFVKIGRLIRFRESDLNKWIEQLTKLPKRGFLDELFGE